MILLSLRSPFADAIYSGLKMHEFRRVCPRHGIPGPALIYEVKPRGMVTGVVFVERAIDVPPGCGRSTAAPGDPYRDYYDRYLEGARKPVALVLSRPMRFAFPQPLEAMTGLRTAPQSYAFVDGGRSQIIAQLRSVPCHSSEIGAEVSSTDLSIY